jgi:serine/threonine protein kinase
MDRSPDWGRIETGAGDRLREIAERFRKAWQKVGGPPDPVSFDAFLPPRDDPLRALALEELIKIDLKNRWQRGQATRLEHYLERFPELGPTRNLSPHLIWEEFRVRQEHGDKPALTAYLSRFPEQFAEVQRLIQLGQQRAQHSGTMSAPELPPTVASSPSDVLKASGGYRLLKVIGQGTFGQVFQAEAPGGIEVAVKKIMRPLAHKDVQRELQALEVIKRLRHPFLLQTQAYWLRQDELLIVMELADGSLSNRLETCHRAGQTGIPVDELLQYFREAAEALDYLHGEQVLHRDVKPQNILLLKGHAKVADFGLARMWDGDDVLQATSCGTPAFMAPEVWKGMVSPQSDQYSLAATYFALRTGRTLFPGNVNAIFEHLEKAPDLSPLPEDEQRVLHKALAKEPAQRHANCRGFIQALAQSVLPGADRPLTVKEAEPVSGPDSDWLSLPSSGPAPGLQVHDRPTKPPARRRQGLPILLIGAIMAAAGALIAFGIWYVGQLTRPADTGVSATHGKPPVPDTHSKPNGEGQPPNEAASPAYVLNNILKDVRGLPPMDRPHVRYLSLDHLRATGATDKQLAGYRDALVEAITYLSGGKDGIVLQEIDPARTVFRVDLRTLGWDQPHFQKIRDSKVTDPMQDKEDVKRVNLFDLALLEYPYATIDQESKVFADVAKEFLEPAGQVRPIAYVRADWFVSAATQPPLAEDLLLHQRAARRLDQKLLAPLTERFAEDVGFAVASAELGVPDSDELQNKLTALADLGLKPLATQGKVSRKTWENAYGQVVRRLGLGTPILALDGLTHPTFQPVPRFDVKLFTKNQGNGEEATVFAPGDQMVIFVHNTSDRDLFIELISSDSEGKKGIVAEAPMLLRRGQTYRYPPGERGIDIKDRPGKEQLILFASAARFPPGELFRGAGVTDRVVHPFYRSPDTAPTKTAKIGLEIETRRKNP